VNVKKLATRLKGVIAAVAACAFMLYAYLIPEIGRAIAYYSPTYSHCFWPWLGFLWATAIPCAMVLVFAWNIAVNIGQDRSFSTDNADLLRRISHCINLDAAFFFAGNIVMLLLNMSHISVLLLSLAIVFAAIVVSMICNALSHLVRKAAVLQDQSDWTI